MRWDDTSKSKANGVVYTPAALADFVAEQMLRYYSLHCNSSSHQEPLRILDPAAGSGELLRAMLQAVQGLNRLIQVVGYETDNKVAACTEQELKTQFPSVQVEIKKADFLEAAGILPGKQFDLIIANPPYIRTQILGKKRTQELKARFSLSGRVDSYHAFLLSTEPLLKPDGVAGFITSNKFLTIKSGSAVRRYLKEHCTLHRIIDLGDTRLFNAAVLPGIVFFSRGNTSSTPVPFSSVYQTRGPVAASPDTGCLLADRLPPETDFVHSSNPAKSGKAATSAAPVATIGNIFEAIERTGVFQLPDGRQFVFQQGVLAGSAAADDLDGLWTLQSPEHQEWLSQVACHTWKTMGDIGRVRVGIKTTADNVFIRADWSETSAGIELLRPLLTHRNAGQFVARTPDASSGLQVLYPHTVINGKTVACELESYPHARAYLLEHFDQLNARKYLKKARKQWYEIWVPQNPEAWARRKIVFRDIAAHPEFWLDDTGAVVNGDCYWIELNPDTTDTEIYLALAVANSSFIERFYDARFNTRLYSGKRRYQSQYVEQFPLPDPDTTLGQHAVSLVQHILTSKDPSCTARCKQELDLMVEAMFSPVPCHHPSP